MHLTEVQWVILGIGAFVTGLSKTGIAGIGVLSAALFASAMDARSSTGALLPLLLCGDLFGVGFFRKHTNWSLLWRLFPWVTVGLVGGYIALGKISGPQIQRIIGIILLLMVVLQIWRERQSGEKGERFPHAWWFAAFSGIMAGFTTMMANAAGPVMVIYLLAVGLPKMEFVGTGAWFFMLVNAAKVPFSVHLGLITWNSLQIDALLLLPMIPGALLGPIILKRMNQRVFERIALILTLLAAVRLVF